MRYILALLALITFPAIAQERTPDIRAVKCSTDLKDWSNEDLMTLSEASKRGLPADLDCARPSIGDYLDSYTMTDAERLAYLKAMKTALDEQCACYRFVMSDGKPITISTNSLKNDGDRILVMMAIRRGWYIPLDMTGVDH